MRDDEKLQKATPLSHHLEIPLEVLLKLELSLLEEVDKNSGSVYWLLKCVKTLPLNELLSLDATRRAAIYECHLGTLFKAKIPEQTIRMALIKLDVSILKDRWDLMCFVKWLNDYKLPPEPLFSLTAAECKYWLKHIPENVQKLVQIGVSFEYLLSLEYKKRNEILSKAYGIGVLFELGLTFPEILNLNSELQSELTERADQVREAVVLGLPLNTLMALHPTLRTALLKVFLPDENFCKAVTNTKVPLAELLTAESPSDEKILLELMWKLYEHPQKARDLVREFIRLKRDAQCIALGCLDQHGFFAGLPREIALQIAHCNVDQTLISKVKARQIAENAIHDVMKVKENRIKK
ncbi:MAG: hypothetical protein SFW07_00575 [Gammaproteobacteria bacterium]|nr:hypothetical protein [Gammaproteobacteria bacterium]